jgi:hypothetical protein
MDYSFASLTGLSFSFLLIKTWCQIEIGSCQSCFFPVEQDVVNVLAPRAEEKDARRRWCGTESWFGAAAFMAFAAALMETHAVHAKDSGGCDGAGVRPSAFSIVFSTLE